MSFSDRLARKRFPDSGRLCDWSLWSWIGGCNSRVEDESSDQQSASNPGCARHGLITGSRGPVGPKWGPIDPLATEIPGRPSHPPDGYEPHYSSNYRDPMHQRPITAQPQRIQYCRRSCNASTILPGSSALSRLETYRVRNVSNVT